MAFETVQLVANLSPRIGLKSPIVVSDAHNNSPLGGSTKTKRYSKYKIIKASGVTSPKGGKEGRKEGRKEGGVTFVRFFF